MAETLGIDPRDEDRLPWLESAEPEVPPRAPVWKAVALILVGLVVLGAAAFALIRYRDRAPATGTGDLIQAQQGPYKVRPGEKDGMRAEGEGDTVFSTSEGNLSNGSVNVGAVPETPVETKAAPTPRATPTAAAGTRVVTRVPDNAGTLTARAPTQAGTANAGSAGGGSVVQLGSFPAEAGANAAWNQLSRRFQYLGPLGKSVQRADVGGRTVYRLRVNAGSAEQAAELCGKLKVAGEACFVAR